MALYKMVPNVPVNASADLGSEIDLLITIFKGTKNAIFYWSAVFVLTVVPVAQVS